MARKDTRPGSAGATVDLGGRVRRLRYTFNALIELEDRLGVSLFGVNGGGLGDALRSLTAKKARTLVWAALLHEEPELTEQEVGDWITMTNLPDVSNAVAAALAEAMPVQEPDAPSRGTAGN